MMRITTRGAIFLATTTAAAVTSLQRPLVASAFSTRLLHTPSLRTLQYFHRPSILYSSNNNDSNNQPSNNFKPTWTYTPYDTNKPPPPRPSRRRNFSTWTVPKTLDIPTDRLDIQFVRSSGSGGQNVNKVNTQVQLRMHVDSQADWIPEEVRTRLCQNQANRINKEGILVLQSQEYRTQAQNKKDVLGKLRGMILEAWPRPKVRKQRKGISKAAKERNKEFKRKRSQTKQNRRKVTDW